MEVGVVGSLKQVTPISGGILSPKGSGRVVKMILPKNKDNLVTMFSNFATMFTLDYI